MLTVLIATRDRANVLKEVLEAYCGLQEPTGGWKLVIIDNGSTDETGAVIASFASRLPVQSVSEPNLGKNRALNVGLGLAEGDLIAFSDDDAFPRPQWLIELRNSADTHSSCSIFGGAIRPRWEMPPPSWVQWVEAGPTYTITNPSWEEGPIAADLIFGPNMAIRTSVFDSGVRFDPAIGPRGTSYAMGSETELVLRLCRQGHTAWHVPTAVVDHLIRKSQLKTSWVAQRGVRYGRGHYRLFYCKEVPASKLWMGIPRHLFRDIPKEALVMSAAWALLKPEPRFRSRWRLNFLCGLAIEARVLTRER
jgi:glycosyltransferase involved in cell wall biosynthesis